MDQPKTIFKAELVGKEIKVEINTSHLPSITYALKVIEMHLMDEMVQRETMKAAAEQPKIITPKIDVGGLKL